MFIELVESQRKPRRSPGGTVASIALHTALISLAIAATASARTERTERRTREVFIRFVPPRAQTSQPLARRAAPKTEPQQTAATAPVIPPVAVATGIPEIAPVISLPVGDPAPSSPASGTGTEAGRGEGGSGPLTQLQVNREVRALRSNRPPIYPEVQRARGVEGEVFARFVVDEKGRVDMKTFEVISASSPAFTNAVRYALERARFEPAEAGGRKVAQLVEQHFQFRLDQ